jgi:hypothetical protein
MVLRGELLLRRLRPLRHHHPALRRKAMQIAVIMLLWLALMAEFNALRPVTFFLMSVAILLEIVLIIQLL